MKNFLTKAIVAAGVMASAMALSSMAVFAADASFVMGDTTAITASAYSSLSYSGTTLSADTELFKDTSNGYTVTALGKTQSIGMVDLSENSNYKNQSIADGALSGTVFNKFLFTKGASSNNFIEIKGVSANQTIGVYWSGADSKGAIGKSASIKIGADNATSVSTAKINYSEHIVTEDEGTAESVIIASTGNRVGVYAVTIKDYDPSVTTYTIQVGESTNANYPTVSVSPTSTNTAGSKVTISWSANDYYLAGSKEVTLTDAMLSDTTYTVPYSAFSDSFVEKVTAKVITSYASLAAANVSTGTYGNSTVFGEYFTFNPTDPTKTIKVEAKAITYANEVDYTNWFNLGGSHRKIDFTVKEPALVQVYFVSNGDNSERSVYIGNATASSKGKTDMGVLTTTVIPTDTINGTTFSVDSNDTIDIYDIRVTPGVKYNTKANGATVVTNTNTYILANVSSALVEANNDELTLTVTNTDSSTVEKTTDSVYKYVKIGNAYFKGDSYIYGTVIENANGKDIKEGVTFSVA